MVLERVVFGAVRVLEDLVALDLEEATQLALLIALLHARQTPLQHHTRKACSSVDKRV
jgi:hypothetical protein